MNYFNSIHVTYTIKAIKIINGSMFQLSRKGQTALTTQGCQHFANTDSYFVKGASIHAESVSNTAIRFFVGKQPNSCQQFLFLAHMALPHHMRCYPPAEFLENFNEHKTKVKVMKDTNFKYKHEGN